MVFLTGSGVTITDDGVYVQTALTSDGLFETTSLPYATELDVGIVAIIETFDAKGQTSADRKVSFYCTRLLTQCKVVYGDSSSAFKPGFFVDIIYTPLPTVVPTQAPTYSNVPTLTPSPSQIPSRSNPSLTPTQAPIVSFQPSLVPSLLPSMAASPSASPSRPPSNVPTMLTIFPNCSFNEDGTMDPNPYLRKAHPELKVATGSAFVLGETSVDEDSIMSRPFGLLSSAPPLSEFSFAAYLGGNLVGLIGGEGNTVSRQAAEVSVILKTTSLYSDHATSEVAFQLSDKDGRTQVLLDGLTVQLILAFGVQ